MNGFAGTVIVTVPLPVPLVGLSVTKLEFVDAVHEAVSVSQPDGETLTVITADPPEAGSVTFAGDTANAQRADCVIVIVCPATVMVPVRAGFPD